MTIRNNLKKGFGGRSFNHSLVENINGTKVFVGRFEFLLDWGVFPFPFHLFILVTTVTLFTLLIFY